MTWRDRQGGDDAGRMGRPGGDWQGVRPTLDNPMTWSLPMTRLFGIAVRVHAVFIIYIVIQLARTFVTPPKDEAVPLDFTLTALNLGCLFGIVLIHEFGHCFACRWTGGESDEILMWPLGGLAYCRPEPRWRAHLITAMGGPMVNVIIFLVLAPVLGFVTGQWWGVAVPNPLGPLGFGGVLGREPWWLLTLVAIHDVSFLLLLFNLLPIFPLDGGRICQALLWSRWGYARSMRLAVYVGYFGAIGLGIFGAATSNWMLVAIAVFGGVTCYVTLKQVEWTDSVVGDENDLYAAAQWSYKAVDDDEETTRKRISRSERRAAEKAARDAARTEAKTADVDRILDKIAREGVTSLTAAEKSTLEQATAQKRRGES